MADRSVAVRAPGSRVKGAARLSRRSAIIFAICLASMASGFFSSSGMKWPFYGAVISLTALTYGSLLMLGAEVRLPRWSPRVLAVFVGYVLVAALANRYVSMAYLEVLFVIGAFIVGVAFRPTCEQLLAVSNAVFAVYLALSVLVYVEAIPLARELALFEYGDLLVLGFPFRTFIGFYGSTAAIDAYALFIAAINFLYGRGWKRWLFTTLGIVASAATLRYTPLVALVLALVATGGWRSMGPGVARKVVAALLVLSCFGSAVVVVAAIEWAGSDAMDTFALLTSGRSPIWIGMLSAFSADANPWVAVWLGTGTHEVYAVDLGFSHGNWISNPHNNYLEFLLKYGIVGWSLLLVFAVLVFSSISHAANFFLAAFVILSGVTNLHTFGFYFPLYLLWLGWSSFVAREERCSGRSISRGGRSELGWSVR